MSCCCSFSRDVGSEMCRSIRESPGRFCTFQKASLGASGRSAHFRSFPGCQRWFCTFQRASLDASGGSAHFRKLPWMPAAVLHISESFPGCQRSFCTFQKASLDASGRSEHFRKLPPLQNASLTLKRKPDCPLFPIP